MSFVNDTTMFYVWMMILVLLILWFIAKYLYDTLCLEEMCTIRVLLGKKENKDINVPVSSEYAYGLDFGLYSPLWLFVFNFHVDDEEITHCVSRELFHKIKVGDWIFVTYGITRLSKKVKIKKIESLEHLK